MVKVIASMVSIFVLALYEEGFRVVDSRNCGFSAVCDVPSYLGFEGVSKKQNPL